jgi:HPt (histidine-containing phosphotransfer) domain-containing protein
MLENGELLAADDRHVSSGLPGSAPPIDHGHLRRYTMGDQQLEREVLDLFAGELPKTMAALHAAKSEREWKIATHTLKGSARTVGAWRLASAAAAAERDASIVHDPKVRMDVLTACGIAVDDALAYIQAATAPGR